MPYLRPYKLLQSLEQRLNLQDEGIIIDEQSAMQIDAAQQAVQESEIESQRLAQGLAQTQAIETMTSPTQIQTGNIEV